MRCSTVAGALPIVDRMKTTFLEFEQPIAELEAKIEELRFVQDDSALDISAEIARLEKLTHQLEFDILLAGDYDRDDAIFTILRFARHNQRGCGVQKDCVTIGTRFAHQKPNKSGGIELCVAAPDRVGRMAV